MYKQKKLEALKEIEYQEKKGWYIAAGHLAEKIGDQKKAKEMFRKGVNYYEKNGCYIFAGDIAEKIGDKKKAKEMKEMFRKKAKEINRKARSKNNDRYIK